MIDEGETDSQLMGIDITGPMADKLSYIKDVEEHIQGLLAATVELQCKQLLIRECAYLIDQLSTLRFLIIVLARLLFLGKIPRSTIIGHLHDY